MVVHYYRMREGQEDSVAVFIQSLFADYGAKFETKLSPQVLRDNREFLNVEVAEENDALIGFCAWTYNFSTWRGIKGMYIADLFVNSMNQHHEVARNLLQLAARNGRKGGAEFMRAEVDVTDEAHSEVFEKVGFWSQKRHAMHFLEADKFRLFTAD